MVGPVLTSRMAAVLADILEVRKTDPEAKFLIFSQYSESLKEAMNILMNLNVTHRQELNDILFDCAIVEGKDSPKEREKNLKRFTEVLSCNVCLLTIGAAAAGLTLTVARVCYLLEPTHSAADEAQVTHTLHSTCVRAAVHIVNMLAFLITTLSTY
jgi:Helicase conserved C-terminal domain